MCPRPPSPVAVAAPPDSNGNSMVRFRLTGVALAEVTGRKKRPLLSPPR